MRDDSIFCFNWMGSVVHCVRGHLEIECTTAYTFRSYMFVTFQIIVRATPYTVPLLRSINAPHAMYK